MLIGAATTRMTAIVGPSAATESGMSAVRIARPRSARNIIRLRSLRSAKAPASMPKTRSGSVWNAPTTPIAKPEPVNARTSSGSAVKLTASPSADTVWLVSRTLKSRFRASGSSGGIAAGSLGMAAMVRRRRMPAMDAPVSATDALIAAGRRLGARGLISAGEGNLSIRLDGERLLVTPTGRRKDELDADDLIVVRLGHDERGARSPSGLAPTSDLAIHLAVHRARPD